METSTPAARTPEPSDAIWDWRGEQPDDASASLSSCPAFQAGIAALASCFLGWRGHLLPARILAGVAVAVLFLGFLFPRAHARVFKGLRFLGLKLGEGLSLVFLAPLYFLILTPFSLWYRIRGRDSLNKSFPSNQASCWQARPEAPSDPEMYRRQF